MINWMDKIKNAQPISEFPVIDCHNHLGKWNNFHIPQNGTIEQIVRAMDRLGIDRVFVTAHSSIGPDYVYGNDMVFGAIEKFPDRVYGYATVNPNYPEDMAHELERCFARPGFRGIKLHPGCHGRMADDRSYTPAFELANAQGLPMLIHVWGVADVAAVERLSAEYPEIRFIMGHCGADFGGMSKAIDLINKRDHVYGDTALSAAQQGNFEWLIRAANPKRILFGSDMPFYGPAHTVARIMAADISDAIKADVFGGNLQRLLDKTDR